MTTRCIATIISASGPCCRTVTLHSNGDAMDKARHNNQKEKNTWLVCTA